MTREIWAQKDRLWKEQVLRAVIPALGILAVAAVLIAGMWVGQGLWEILWIATT